ncbi:MAG TPA: hemolysin family protein [Actinomycetota bacterium]|nr:hemolysin family protein [Actinomycetota bacterium]
MTLTQTQLALAGLAIMFAFVTSAWVNAIQRLTLARAELLANNHPKKGALLVKIAGNTSNFLTSVLLVMLLLRVTATVFVTSTVLRQGWPVPELIAVAIMSVVLFEFAELAPRTWVLERLDNVLLAAARPVYLIGSALGPLASILIKLGRFFLLILPGRGLPKGPLLSEEEIKGILDVAQFEEVIQADEREMIHSIFEFTDTVVREVMVPRPDMVWVDAAATLEEVLDVTLKSGHSRIPVISENIDNVIGIVYQKDVIRRLHNGGRSKAVNKKASDIKREAVFVPESKKVAELLRDMQQAKTHMVVVVDEYGGVAGVATMEDLLEEIVGEITDEYDRDEPNVSVVGEDAISVTARLSIEELSELLDVELPHSEWDSVGGLVGGMLGRLATPGDTVQHDGIEFEVHKMKGRRISHVLVRGAPVAASPAVKESH